MSNWFDRAKAWTSEAAVKVTEATQKGYEKTKDATIKAKEIAKQKLGRMETAQELTKILEEKARNAVTLTQIADLHRSWISSMNRKDGPSYILPSYAWEENLNNPDADVVERQLSTDAAVVAESPGEQTSTTTSSGDTSSSKETTPAGGGKEKENKSIFSKISSVVSKRAGSHEAIMAEREAAAKDPNKRILSFKQVFLRSRALEITMETILCDEYMRKRFAPPTPDDHSSHSFYFYSLLQNALSCPPEIWGGLLRTATEAELLTDYHIRWLSRLFGVLKIDWLDEVFHSERKDMAVRAEQLRNEIRSVKTALPSLTDLEIEKHHKKKVTASRDLVQLYKGLRVNMEEALKHRQVTLQKRDENMKNLELEMTNYKTELGSTTVSSMETREKLTKELAEAAEVLKVDLESIDKDRLAVDQEIEELEVRKKNLKLEIEEVTQLLLIARQKQKHFMTEQDQKRNNMYSEKNNFKRQISEKERLALECEIGGKVLEEIHKIVEVTEKQMSASLGKQISELGKKRDQFDQHFVEVLRDHCRYEDDRLVSIGEIAKVSCSRLIKLNDGDETLVMQETAKAAGAATGDGSSAAPQQLTRAEFLVRERHVFTKATHDLELVWTDIMSFKKQHEDIIASSPVLKDLVSRMETKYRQIKQHLSPGLEMMVQASMQSPVGTPDAGSVGSIQPTEAQVEAMPPVQTHTQVQQAPPPPPPAPPVVVEKKEAPPAPAAPPAPVVAAEAKEQDPAPPVVVKQSKPEPPAAPTSPVAAKVDAPPPVDDVVDAAVTEPTSTTAAKTAEGEDEDFAIA